MEGPDTAGDELDFLCMASFTARCLSWIQAPSEGVTSGGAITMATHTQRHRCERCPQVGVLALGQLTIVPRPSVMAVRLRDHVRHRWAMRLICI